MAVSLTNSGGTSFETIPAGTAGQSVCVGDRMPPGSVWGIVRSGTLVLQFSWAPQDFSDTQLGPTWQDAPAGAATATAGTGTGSGIGAGNTAGTQPNMQVLGPPTWVRFVNRSGASASGRFVLR